MSNKRKRRKPKAQMPQPFYDLGKVLKKQTSIFWNCPIKDIMGCGVYLGKVDELWPREMQAIRNIYKRYLDDVENGRDLAPYQEIRASWFFAGPANDNKGKK